MNITSVCGYSAVMSPGRWLFSRVTNPEEFVPDGEPVEMLRTELRGACLTGGESLRALIAKATQWSSAEAERFRAYQIPTGSEVSHRMVRKAVLWWAPIGLASGAWLQWLTSPANADQPIFLKILQLYASDVGSGHPRSDRGSAYLGVLRQLRASERATPLARLASDPRIDDRAFHLSAMLLLMSRRPEEFYQELIGADLCLRAIGMPPPVVLAMQSLQLDSKLIDYSSPREGLSPLEHCYEIAESLLTESADSAARVGSGFAWALSTLIEQIDALHDQLRGLLDPWCEMASLMKLRAREGSVYHERVQLEGRSLQDWLKECLVEARPFLEALARSKLVKPGHSDISPLVNELVSERGRMFRIFSPDDLVVIRRWIDALPDPGGLSNHTNTPLIEERARKSWLSALPALLDTGAPSNSEPKNLREAYHKLITRSGSAEIRNWSMKYVVGWLARTQYRMHSASVPLPTIWRPEHLRQWLKDQHDRHAAEFTEKANTPLPSREALIDDAVQTALLTLIDGSWLQGFADYEFASSDIGHSLFSTYWDELGNGEPDLNHPRIYRETLKGMGINLPPTGSLEFVNWPGFRDASFELPVYWLSIGRFPRTFLPETLGLNLAMELSGVGGAYRRGSKALQEYGFSTRFVDIHNTIDNVATGHSAWAADAIDAFMATLPDSTGPGSRSHAWHRIRTGYRSLNPPEGFMARLAAARATGSLWRLRKLQ